MEVPEILPLVQDPGNSEPGLDQEVGGPGASEPANQGPRTGMAGTLAQIHALASHYSGVGLGIGSGLIVGQGGEELGNQVPNSGQVEALAQMREFGLDLGPDVGTGEEAATVHMGLLGDLGITELLNQVRPWVGRRVAAATGGWYQASIGVFSERKFSMLFQLLLLLKLLLLQQHLMFYSMRT